MLPNATIPDSRLYDFLNGLRIELVPPIPRATLNSKSSLGSRPELPRTLSERLSERPRIPKGSLGAIS